MKTTGKMNFLLLSDYSDYRYGRPSPTFNLDVDIKDLYKIVPRSRFKSGYSFERKGADKKTIRYRTGIVDRIKNLKTAEGLELFWEKEFADDPNVLKALLKSKISLFTYWKFFKGKDFTYRRGIVRSLLRKTKNTYGYGTRVTTINLWLDKRFLQIMTINEIADVCSWGGEIIPRAIKPKDLGCLSEGQVSVLLKSSAVDFKAFKKDDLKYVLTPLEENYTQGRAASFLMITKVLAAKGRMFFEKLKDWEGFREYKKFLATNQNAFGEWQRLMESKKSRGLAIKEFLNQVSVKQFFYLIDYDAFLLGANEYPTLRKKMQDMFLDIVKTFKSPSESKTNGYISVPRSLAVPKWLTVKSIRKILKTLKKYNTFAYEKFVNDLIANINDCPPYASWYEYDTVSPFGITIQQHTEKLKEEFKKKNAKRRRRKTNGKRVNNKSN